MEIASQIYRKIKWQVEKFVREVYWVVLIYRVCSGISGLVLILKNAWMVIFLPF